MALKTYSLDLLKKTILKDCAKLLETYSEKEVNSTLKVHFQCKCGKETTKGFRVIVVSVGAFCESCTRKIGVENQKKNMIEKYGVTNISKLESIKEKKKAKAIKKFGVECVLNSYVVKEKCLKTLKEKYKVSGNITNVSQIKEIKDKKEKAAIHKYGVKSTLQAKEVKEKIKSTMLEKYGVDNISKRVDYQEKAMRTGKKYKTFKTPSGVELIIQGYEPFALNILFKTFEESDIETRRSFVPKVEYKFSGKDKTYYPDIFIKSLNKIIEVKSTWTYKCKSDNIYEKAKACIEKGYDTEIWIFTAKGELTLINKEYILKKE